MERNLFKDNETYAINGKDYKRVFHAGPCVAVSTKIDKELNIETFKNPVQIINFFYPVEDENNLIHIKLGNDEYYAYDISKVHSLINCNDNWICCLKEAN